MTFSLATWNINSVRLRIDDVARFVAMASPDVLCLQETKCADDRFPHKAFREMGYQHHAINGQKGYHGVAILSRYAFEDIERREFCAQGDARHIAVTLTDGPARGLRIHDFYVPAGGDEPDTEINPKFAHKLSFLDEMEAWDALAQTADGPKGILVGDLNIAPLEQDVWSSRQLTKVVSHTPIERQRLTDIIKTHGWHDALRAKIPPNEKLYTWWSYRSANWQEANKGRRLDHIWTHPDLAGALDDVQVFRECRGWERPSDHVPVLMKLKL